MEDTDVGIFKLRRDLTELQEQTSLYMKTLRCQTEENKSTYQALPPITRPSGVETRGFDDINRRLSHLEATCISGLRQLTARQERLERLVKPLQEVRKAQVAVENRVNGLEERQTAIKKEIEQMQRQVEWELREAMSEREKSVEVLSVRCSEKVDMLSAELEGVKNKVSTLAKRIKEKIFPEGERKSGQTAVCPQQGIEPTQLQPEP
ncbi:hypothetical protein AAMO2058_001387100 [Amorphochlora amoebiformis]